MLLGVGGVFRHDEQDILVSVSSLSFREFCGFGIFADICSRVVVEDLLNPLMKWVSGLLSPTAQKIFRKAIVFASRRKCPMGRHRHRGDNTIALVLVEAGDLRRRRRVAGDAVVEYLDVCY